MIQMIILLFSINVIATQLEITCLQDAITIDQKLSCLEGITFKQLNELDQSTSDKIFEIQFVQPTDHFNLSSEKFNQKLVLIHSSENEPMVLQTSGYSIFGIKKTSLATLFGTNQLQVEHRYFSTSKPQILDWSLLNIEQAANDFHKITEKFKQIYTKSWVNTGASKGGMTSIYHKRFFPNDLDGTVADVAPLSFSTLDQRYADFVNQVGGDNYFDCREKFKKFQITLLKNKNLLVPKIAGNFNQLDGSAVAFEHAVTESSFIFWQYGNPDDLEIGCSTIPSPTDDLDKQLEYLQTFNSLENYTDEMIGEFMPYYYQAATQLGNADTVTSHISKFINFLFTIHQYTPKNVSYKYSNEAMVDVDKWMRSDADKILMVYGEFDPWSAGAFSLSESGKDVHKFIVPKGNHGSKFTKLSPEDKDRSIQILSGWFKKEPKLENLNNNSFYLDELELKAMRR